MKPSITRRSLLILLLVLSFIAGCASVAPEQQKEADFHYKMGVSYLNEGQPQKGFVEFQKALQIDADHKEALNSLGLIYVQWGELEKARGLFLKATALDPHFSDAYNNLGITYRESGQWREAVDAFKQALTNPLYQSPEWALYNLGVTYYRSGQPELAIETFKDSLKRSPSLSLPYYGLALSFNKTGRYGDAASALERAVGLDPAYQGNRAKFADDIRQRLLTAQGAVEAEFRDYLEIMRY